MQAVSITVFSYSGYRGEEIPREFLIEGKRIGVAKIKRMWIAETQERKRLRYFEAEGSDGKAYTLFYDEELALWFLDSIL
jgi:hypothetical protein